MQFDYKTRARKYILEGFDAIEQQTRYKLLCREEAFGYRAYVDKEEAVLSPIAAKAKALWELNKRLKDLEDRLIETQKAIEQVEYL